MVNTLCPICRERESYSKRAVYCWICRNDSKARRNRANTQLTKEDRLKCRELDIKYVDPKWLVRGIPLYSQVSTSIANGSE